MALRSLCKTLAQQPMLDLLRSSSVVYTLPAYSKKSDDSKHDHVFFNDKEENGAHMPENVSEHQGGEHEFYAHRATDIMEQHVGSPLNISAASSQHSSASSQAQADYANAYSHTGHVSMHGVMQSNVPEPFQPSGRNPTHLNMPSGGVKMGDKYIAGKIHDAHPSVRNKFHTYAPLHAIRGNVQGPQGDNCAHHALWLESCDPLHQRDCQDAGGVITGRKTLQDVFEEQEKKIRSVAPSHHNMHSIQGVQDVRYFSSTSGLGKEKTEPVSVTAEEAVQLSARQKLQRAVKEYGSTVIVFHVGISLMSLGGFYTAVSSGIDMVGLLQQAGVGQSILESKLASGASTFVVAYAVHKVFAPVRIGITLTATPIIVQYLRRKGVLKPPAPK